MVMDSFNTQPLSKLERAKLDDFLISIKRAAPTFLGYPCTREFDYSPLFPLLEYPINNVGDPFQPNHYKLNSHEFERDVIQSFTRFTHGNIEDVWGYVTNGGTEGNLCGAYLARETYPHGMFYYSEASHYSIPKILRIINVDNIKIKCQPSGEMDYESLDDALNFHKNMPPIIMTNVGTTMTGAIDDINKIKRILKNNKISEYYIHVDAALSGMIIPFLKNPPPFGFDFGIDSLAISGHKMVGSPIPCGIILAKQHHVNNISRVIEYIGSNDTTITGSRNGITPLFLWYAINTKGMDGFRTMITHCFELAKYAIIELNKIGIKAWRNDNSIIVVFPKINKDIMDKWQMAVEGDIAHIIIMPHVTKLQLNVLFKEIQKTQVT
jgi:histidine decarboxylase